MLTTDARTDVDGAQRDWVHAAVRTLRADQDHGAETPLLRFPLPEAWGVDLYLKDERAHPTGSLKHRLARSLFLYGLCNGWIGPHTTVVEASSGSTAISEAHFARMLGLPFVAVVPRTTSAEKVHEIEGYGATCHLVDEGAAIYETAARIARDTGGHYMDQFTYAERATGWTDEANIAAATLQQLRGERFPVPEWMVVGAGTGGTSATLGRHLRFAGHPTRVCVVDPDGSVFRRAWETGDRTLTAAGSRIEGIGRPRVEPSFIPTVVDRIMHVPDGASIAAMLELCERTGIRGGASTGTSLWGALQLVASMRAAGRRGSVVTFVCDSGDRYHDSYYDAEWCRREGIEQAGYRQDLVALLDATA